MCKSQQRVISLQMIAKKKKKKGEIETIYKSFRGHGKMKLNVLSLMEKARY